jgi:hypothetical protein
MDNGVNGLFITKKLVYKFIEHSIKNESMKGNTEYQYNSPNSSWFKGSSLVQGIIDYFEFEPRLSR